MWRLYTSLVTLNALCCINPIPILSNYEMSLYPEVNIAFGSIVSSMSMLFKALNGSKTNWCYGIKRPRIDDISGILNVRWDTGTFWGIMTPFAIWHWGTVGEMNGSRTPFAKLGENKLE